MIGIRGIKVLSGIVLFSCCLAGLEAGAGRGLKDRLRIDGSPADAGSISGRVTDASAAAIANSSVVAYGSSGDFVSHGQTDSNGNYAFSEFPVGDYKVYFGNYGVDYVAEWYNDKSSFAMADSVAVTAGGITADINARLAAGGRITGRVTNSAGAGIANICVRAYALDQYLVWGIYTDSSGYYSIIGLYTGNYKVEFCRSGLNYISEWYNDKDGKDAADPVAVTAGNTTSNINAQLAAGGRIMGRVTDASGAGIAEIRVIAYGLNSIYLSEAKSDSGGNYAISGFKAGQYKLEFNNNGHNYLSEWYSDKPSFGAANQVAVTAGGTTAGINAQLVSGGKITGRVTDASGTGIRSIYVCANDLNNRPINASSTDYDGKYEISALPSGKYKVYFMHNAGDYVLEWYNDKGSFETADQVAVIVGKPTPNINARMVSTGQISGRVTDSSGAGLENIEIGVYDLNHIFRSHAYSDAGGNYAVTGFSSGNYKVRFSHQNNYYVMEWYNDKADFETADMVGVTAGGTKSGIDAQLATAGQIAGRVTDTSGAGIENIEARVFDLTNKDMGFAFSDSNGNYVISSLPSGNYKVEFCYIGVGNFLSEWYDDKADFDTADPVVATVGDITPNIDAQLAAGGQISGRVTDVSGAGIENISVHAFDHNHYYVGSTGWTDSNGFYTISGLPTDTYSAFFNMWNGNYSSKTVENIAVTAGGMTSNIDAQLVRSVPTIVLSKTSFNFGTERNGTPTPAETVMISNSGSGTLNWTVTPSADWISVSPSGGNGAGMVTIGISRTSLAVGLYTGTIAFTDPAATNSPQTITIRLEVKKVGADSPPFGNFATPLEGATVASSIPVTGWALDDIGMKAVKIYRGTSGADRIYIGDATFVEGARPDVKTAYPTYPQNNRAGWGYMLLTNFLPNDGNGAFTLLAYAKDSGDHEVLLGSKTITCDNAHAVKPFGAIDTPVQGGTAAGETYVNFGWALTPQPELIPTNGSTIRVYVDGVPLGHPVYNNYRKDIATLFPGYANSDGAVGYYYLNTTGYADGVHTIAWSVTDSGGNTDGIGSRYFSIQNAGGASESDDIDTDEKASKHSADVSVSPRDREIRNSSSRPQSLFSPQTTAGRQNAGTRSIAEISAIPEDGRTPVFIKRGWGINQQAETIFPETDGSIRIEIPEVSRVTVYLNGQDAGGLEAAAEKEIRVRRISGGAKSAPQTSGNSRYEAFELVGEELRPLPIGASFDSNNGVFFWQPGPGFLGEYQFVFINNATMTRKTILVKIIPSTEEVETSRRDFVTK